MTKFDWARMYKDEEYIEREAYSCVESAICLLYTSPSPRDGT